MKWNHAAWDRMSATIGIGQINKVNISFQSFLQQVIIIEPSTKSGKRVMAHQLQTQEFMEGNQSGWRVASVSNGDLPS
jgi:hypothetical protein